ncbi:50S ribosomal protein L23, chloroplastic, partial [Cucurbita argyrosperma subsp. argyrosperma]
MERRNVWFVNKTSLGLNLGIKHVGFTDKTTWLLGKLQYTSNVESTEIKHCVKLFFGVKVIAMNSHRLPKKSRRMRPVMRHTMH